MKKFRITSLILLVFMILSSVLYTSCAKKEVFTIGLDATFAPMGFTDEDGKIVGFDIDLANEVAKILNWDVKFQPIAWESKELELESKRIDCIWNGMSKTPSREEAMELTKPYMNNTIIIVGRDASSYTDLSQFVGKKLTVQAESSALEVMQANSIYDQLKANVTEFGSYDECYLELKTGRVDYIVIDKVAFYYKNEIAPDDEKLEVSPVDFGIDYYVVGCRKGETELVKSIEEAIQQLIDNGKASEFSKKWLGEDIYSK